MRPLTLHASALNDDEYNLYTSSILDLALNGSNYSDHSHTRDDTFYEQISVSVRETRAWLRGRYPDIQVSTIDAILKLFAPTLSQRDTLSGGQFFTALRLIVHAQNGSDVDRSFAFVQARPPLSANTTSVKKSSSDLCPPQLPLQSEASSTISEPGPTLTNPFSYEAGQHPPLHPSQRPDASKAIPSPNNPFISQNKTTSPRSEDGSSRIPPLPPRKPSNPAPPPPPRHSPVSPPQSTRLQPHLPHNLRSSPSSTPHSHPPTHPPLPSKNKPVTHVTSTLMKQSLQASKTAQTLKKAEEQLEKERVLQVLRSSAVVSGAHVRPPTFSSRSRSPSTRVPTPPVSMSVASSSVIAKSDSSASWSGSEEKEQERERPPLPQRRNQQRQLSPHGSTYSLEQVALAVAPSGGRSRPHSPYASSPFDSPIHSPRMRQTLDLPGVAGLPPPTHPDRKLVGLSHQSTQAGEVSPSSLFQRDLESFEAIYGTSSQPSPTTSSLSADTPTTPTPPVSISDTFTSSSSPQQRMHRSKSLHHQPHPNLPPPPPPTRRKRPESIQVLSNGEALFGAAVSPKSVSAGSSSLTFDSHNSLKNSMSHTPSPHRRTSNSSSFGGSTSSSTALGTGASGSSATVMSGGASGADMIQRRIAELQLRAENAIPALEKARYKAEAGLSRRGFIQGSIPSNGSGAGQRSRSRGNSGGREDREGLMSRYRDDQYGVCDADADADGEFGSDIDSGDEDEPRGRGKREDTMVLDRDALKWPAGEGWKML